MELQLKSTAAAKSEIEFQPLTYCPVIVSVFFHYSVKEEKIHLHDFESRYLRPKHRINA